MSGTEVAEALRANLNRTRIFLSMPYIEGITPSCMRAAGVRKWTDGDGLERRDGYFDAADAGLSPFDHGNLYGDAVFEGIRIDDRRVLLLREHIDRWINSANRLGIAFPYDRTQLCEIIAELSRQALGKDGRSGYLRPVLTRGIGNLGVNPQKCIGPTVYAICSAIALYPQSSYERGIDVAIARDIRRNDACHLDPNIKTNNYLNNVFALLETKHAGAYETLMLTRDGYVAEATADNIFVAQERNGHRELRCPASRYALEGLTRALIMKSAQELGFDVAEDGKMLPTDFVGANREVFITGTACGLMPVRSIDGLETAGEGHRPLLDMLRSKMAELSVEPSYSFGIDSDSAALKRYMSEPTKLGRARD